MAATSYDSTHSREETQGGKQFRQIIHLFHPTSFVIPLYTVRETETFETRQLATRSAPPSELNKLCVERSRNYGKC